MISCFTITSCYIYKEINEDSKVKVQNAYEKARNELIKSFSREEQIAQGVNLVS